MLPFPERIRPVSWTCLALVILANLGASLVWARVFPVASVLEALGLEIRPSTVVIAFTVVNVFDLFLLVIVGLFLFGGVRPVEVGWRLSAMGQALLATLLFWAAMQPAMALVMIARDQPLQWNSAWNDPGGGILLGQLFSQLVGNALLEETIFRGFLLPQVYLKAAPSRSRALALALALLTSQLVFTLMHLPGLVFRQSLAVARIAEVLVENFFLGLALSGVFVVTRNLFICVGLHAIWNQPARLLPLPFKPWVMFIWYVLAVLLMVGWMLGGRWRDTHSRAGGSRVGKLVRRKDSL